jgi:hypothetical protein
MLFKHWSYAMSPYANVLLLHCYLGVPPRLQPPVAGAHVVHESSSHLLRRGKLLTYDNCLSSMMLKPTNFL